MNRYREATRVAQIYLTGMVLLFAVTELVAWLVGGLVADLAVAVPQICSAPGSLPLLLWSGTAGDWLGYLGVPTGTIVNTAVFGGIGILTNRLGPTGGHR